MNNFFTKINIKSAKEPKDEKLVKTDLKLKILASSVAIVASIGGIVVAIQSCGKPSVDNSIKVEQRDGGTVIAPVFKGNSNSLIVSSPPKTQVDDHSTQSHKFENSFNSNSGNINFGNQSNSGDNSHNTLNGGGKMITGGTDNSINIGGQNSGVIVNGNSNVTVINIWMNDAKFNFPSAGKFTFPPNPSGKMAELKELAQTEDFKQALRPFTALGTLQPERNGLVYRLAPDLTSSVAKPIAYSKLIEVAALQSDIKSQERLVKMATSKDAMRPRWPIPSWQNHTWIQNPDYTRLIQNAQKWINDYHEEMVQLGMLSE